MRIISLAILTAVFLSSPVYALRCGSKIVDEGDSKIHVLSACGQPLMTEVIGYTNAHPGSPDLKIEQWTYDLNRRYYQLVFEGGTLKKITHSRK